MPTASTSGGARTGDLVGFGDAGVYTSLANGDGTFTPAHYVVPEFGYNQGWRVEQHPRQVADITGDQRADIVGFANNGVYTVTSHGDGSFELPVTVQVPELRGLTATGAASALQAAGLVLGSQGIAIDYTCLNIGRVIRQSPVTGPR